MASGAGVAVDRDDNINAYHWLSAGYRPPPCIKCNGKDTHCDKCGGTGRGPPVFSRTDAIRREQEAAGHQPCYGVFGKYRRAHDKAVTPAKCGEPKCPYRRSCAGLHLNSRYHSERIREESVEYLSRLFLSARAIERRAPQLSPYQADVAQLVQQWADDTPQVAVLGAFSAGKSTLINRLIDKSLLPATRTPTTAVVTSIKHDESAHGVLYYRTLARLTLLSQDARSPDPAAVQAMRTWLSAPERYGVCAIREVNDRGSAVDVDREHLLRVLDALTIGDGSRPEVAAARSTARVVGELRRAIGRRVASPTERLARTFEVHFAERHPQDIGLVTESDVLEFGRHLTEPSLALSLIRAICYLPDPRLRSLNFLDTAGLCSPVGFHRDVTAELLKRRPDKILVLLDARRLNSPTNREALKVLGRFVSVPDDYRQVTFGLTFWDHALRTHMIEDSEPELDFDSPELRSATDRRFARSKREELASLLSSSVGVACESEPVIFTLGLGTNAPPEMRRSLDDLWRHLERDCGGWVGVEMWAERWRAARGLSERLLDLHRETTEELEETKSQASDTTDVNAELARLNAQEHSVASAIVRAEKGLRELVNAQKKRMLAEVACLDSKTGILSYLDSGYWKSANEALNSLQEKSKRANVSLVELYRRAQVLRVISFDRKLLGLDTSVRKRAKGEVTGFLYGLKSIWDFLFGGVVELNESNRDAVREILRGQVRETVDLLESAVDGWGEQGKRVSHQASAEYAERRESLSAKKVDFAHYAEGLQRKLRFLSNCEPPVRDLCSRIAEFADRLDKANARIKASRQPDFSAVLFTDDGELTLRKDRGQDLLLLSDLDKCKCRWKSLEIRSGGRSSHFFPIVSGGGKRVTFIQERAIGRGNDEPILVPDGAIRFELRLSTLDGNFVVGRRSVSTVPAEQMPNGPDASSPKRASG